MDSRLANPTLNDLQDYIRDIEIRRGFSEETALQKCLLLGEEVGELFKAVRRATGMRIDPDSRADSIEDELADVLSFIIAIANRCEVNLADAFREKEKRNGARTWR